MKTNAAGLVVAGSLNPNWKGGPIPKVCAQCGAAYISKRTNANSRFCSLQCVGLSQRGRHIQKKNPRQVVKTCAVCKASFSIFTSHAHRYQCCSMACSHRLRAKKQTGEQNPNWKGGLSRLPYPWDFRHISRQVIERDGRVCQNPDCAGKDARMTTHHINYDKQDNRPMNLIALCATCNSKANFGREQWAAFYHLLMLVKIDDGGGWSYEWF